MGLAYQNHGAPLSPFGGVQYNYFPVANSQGPIFGLGSNQLSGSFLALRESKRIAEACTASSLCRRTLTEYGLLSNGFGSITQNKRLAAFPYQRLRRFSGNGQAFNGMAYAGLSSPFTVRSPTVARTR